LGKDDKATLMTEAFPKNRTDKFYIILSGSMKVAVPSIDEFKNFSSR
jgi:hypothetical protein